MDTWKLDTIYASDAAFDADLKAVKKGLTLSDDLKGAALSLQKSGACLKQLSSYASCLIAEDPSNPDGHTKTAQVSALSAEYEGALFPLAMRLKELDDRAFAKLLEDPELKGISFFLTEERKRAAMLGPKATEELINAFSPDGYHAYWTLYLSVTSKVKVGEKGLSVGQAYNLLSDPDRAVREKAFVDWTEAWKGYSDLLGQLLNHVGGGRWTIYGSRGWDDILMEPLFMNRMSRETFDAMWKAVEAAKPVFLKYLKKKAELLGVDKLSWVDVEAPIASGEEIPYETAVEEILREFEKIHPPMASFSKMAIESGWVEAADRSGKAPGGFCINLPKTKESRIFMTYKGTPINVSTLAHELGHAYHNECLKDLPYFCQEPPMNLAETASTFAESIVIDQMVRHTDDPKQKKVLLDDKLGRCVAFFMNLHARLIFERAFYAKRKEGFVPVSRLCTLMESAQKEAYCDALSSWDPYFWASKLHFYATDAPFYNFPYTFGFLMSTGIYSKVKEEGRGEIFDQFLRDTGRMRVEPLCQKHLNADVTKEDFWRGALAPLIQDVDTFLSL